MKKINIIYLLPEIKKASGGAKVIYSHSVLLNRLDKDVSSIVIHLKKKLSYKIEESLNKRLKIFKKKFSGWDGKKMRVSQHFSPNKQWFESDLKKSKKIDFNKNVDFIILPEICSHFAEDIGLIKNKINYAIFIQGFFHMNSTNDYEKLKKSYKHAKIILSDSEYSIKCFKNIFPELKDKIFRVHFSIDSKKFKIKKKYNIITYMPRKLPDHSSLLIFYLKSLLPKNWKIVPLKNVSEKYLTMTLAKSKIFLSFSNFEGIGIPPIEAALSGNKVIGYTGGGGVEYWKSPIFTKVESGEINDFGQKLLKEINHYKNDWIKKTERQRSRLSKQYSMENERKSLNSLAKKIREFF